MEDKLKILCATGQDSFDLVLKNFEEFEVVDTVNYKQDLIETCYSLNPDIVVVTDNLGGKEYLFKILISLRVICPNTRVVYFCGKIDFNDTIRVCNLNLLISSGIFDIIEDSEIDINLIRFILNNPRERSHVDYIENNYMDSIYPNRQNMPIKFSYSVEEEEIVDNDVFNNLHVFISSKHGTGKSFIVGNAAIAIANMGINKKGSKPRVALIDLDLEGFSLSNNFDTFSDDKNVLDAVRESQKIVTDYGIADNINLQHEVIDNIKKMLIPTKNYPNIKILCGPKRSFREEEYCEVRPNDIVFIIETIINDYDIILVDTNSDAEYSKIFPLFSMARNVYSVLEMNMNALKNENRLKGHIDNYLNKQKLKYILNKDVENGDISSSLIEEELNYSFISKIPAIDSNKMFNLDFKKEFLINQNERDLLKSRYEIIKIANDIWPIKNFEILDNKMKALFNEKVVEEKKDYSNKWVGMIMKSIGLDAEDEDAIKSSVKNSKVVEKAKNFSFKETFNKFKFGAKAISSDIEKNRELKKLENKNLTEQEAYSNKDIENIEDNQNNQNIAVEVNEGFENYKESEE